MPARDEPRYQSTSEMPRILSQTPMAIYLRAWRERQRKAKRCSHCTALAVEGLSKCQRHLEAARLWRKGVG